VVVRAAGQFIPDATEPKVSRGLSNYFDEGLPTALSDLVSGALDDHLLRCEEVNRPKYQKSRSHPPFSLSSF
jgi:hypothetical protein